jgi:hypothetical protein
VLNTKEKRKMKEREFIKKIQEQNENLRGFTDCLIFRVYWSLDKKGNVILDTDSLNEDFNLKLDELLSFTKQN